MNSIRLIDVTPVEGISRVPSKGMLNKLKHYKSQKAFYQKKSINFIHKETKLSIRSIIRLRLIEKYGSELTINNIYSGKITLSFAEIKIKKIIDQEKEKESIIQQDKRSKMNIVNDTRNGGEEITLEYFTARNEFFNQVLLSKSQEFSFVSRSLIEKDLINMIELIQEA
jgi:hypothetical protein